VLLGAFVKLRITTIASSCLSVCLCVWNNSVPTEPIFVKLVFEDSRKSVEKLRVSLNSYKNKRFFTLRPIHIFITPPLFLLGMGNISDKNCSVYQNTHFVLIDFFENRVVYEIMWKNFVERGRPRENMAYSHCVLDT
jgi:hypothetical protein